MVTKKKILTVLLLFVFLIGIIISGHFFYKRREAIIQQKAEHLYGQAEQLRVSGKYTEALAVYKEILSKYGSYYEIVEVQFKIGNVLLHQLHQMPEAEKYYSMALRGNRRNRNHRRIPDVMVELAAVYRAEYKFKEAISLLERLLAQNPARVDKSYVYFKLEMLYAEVGNREKSAEFNAKRRDL